MADSRGRLEGKVALITGAGNGMGLATTRLFAEERAKVIAVDISAKDLETWNGNANVVPVTADITKIEDIERMVSEAEKRFGRLDAVCNIAGINDLGYPLEDLDDDRWDRIHNLDLKAPFRILRRAIPFMLKNGGGAIVNIGSYAAVRGNHGPSYTSAKAGLVGLTKSIAVQYAEQGIRCNIINPGGAQTSICEHSGGKPHPAMASLSKICAAMPVRCYLDPIEIARACLFLCSDESKFINGAVLAVDKGMACC
jgi:NAD(P)-dependent dehydrogenase (short-subunit alcohol dehydrogenase family)